MITPAAKKSKKSLNPAELDLSYKPLENSKKIYLKGKLYPDLKVPFREVSLSPSFSSNQTKIENPPVRLYDTSGPYTDPAAKVDISKGLAELRKPWILDRGDVEELPDFSSRYQKQRLSNENRFPVIKRPLKAKPEAAV